ncbi:MAG: DNA polymerase beta subunit [Candidatus Magnetoglobus multicellularis str. Araruama]|uniref:DNA polymerase beta subunit n=1 Tax=Candidatus Magnetoglobus multicellularis str. Araruama TaxID=890399 RepID=A0A1V1P4V6_9BACT|nr:MAG: DNA polymerase beta subunit [Candidatus Magnetoglobus multicellularis str. Araruama]
MKTDALTIKKIIENLEKRETIRLNNRLSLYNKAISDFKTIVEVIIDKYQPLKIIQWGSLLEPSQFDENSDIDIAVAGIPQAERYFALLGDAMSLTRFPLDIIQLEKIEPEFAELIISKGKLIYEYGKSN